MEDSPFSEYKADTEEDEPTFEEHRAEEAPVAQANGLGGLTIRDWFRLQAWLMSPVVVGALFGGLMVGLIVAHANRLYMRSQWKKGARSTVTMKAPSLKHLGTTNGYEPACAPACAPNEHCEVGTCVYTCTNSLVLCGDNKCIDVMSDDDHCGGCHNQCETNEECIHGICEGMKARTDACGNTCIGDEECRDGRCVLDCGSGRDCTNDRFCDDLTNPSLCGLNCITCAPYEECDGRQCYMPDAFEPYKRKGGRTY